ncbi:MAG: response regulator transcription factor [Ignavibacteriae bacterium]|nr:response regulator transcription factor [Ignavibacteriota bacterium]
MNATQPKTIRVAIVEDHDDFREGLSQIISFTEGFKCVGTYSSVEQALPRMPDTDVVLMDIGLPGKSGIEALAPLKKKYPDTQVIMLTVFEDDKHIFEAITKGANGYLLKKTPPSKLLHAIEEAYSGGMPMTPFIARNAIEMFKKYVPQESSSPPLTSRETEVLRLLVEGLNYTMVAEKLFISLDTVRNHFRHIYEKLQVHSKSEAVAKALKERLV